MIQAKLPMRARLASAGLLLLAASCDSGADVGTFGGGAPPASPLDVDFRLRTDLILGATQTADAIPVDLDGDGQLDVVEANFLDGTIRTALRDPLGSFVPGETVAGGGGAVWRLGSGDVDGDGLVDVVAVEVHHGGLPGSAPGVTVFFQDAPGSFGAVETFPLFGEPIDLDVIPGAPAPGVIGGGAVGGTLIVVAETTAARLALVRWNGAALEGVGQLSSAPLGMGRPLTIAKIDVGADGLADLAVGEIDVSGSQPDRIVLYPADGLGGFGSPMMLSLSAAPILDAVGDVDGNGFEDLGVAQLESDQGQILRFDAGGLLAIDPVELPGGSSSIVFGDFDGDGLGDMAATILFSQELVVLMATPTEGTALGFEPPVIYSAGQLPRTVAAVDLDGDLTLDLICPSDEGVSMLFGDGDGGFRAARGFPVGEQPVLVKAADLDGDGDQDVLTVDVLQRQFGFLENLDGAGTLELVAEVPFTVPAEIELPGGFDVGDLDGDGRPDVVIALHAMGEVRVLHNPGSVAGFATADFDSYPLGEGLYGVVLVDVNGDEALDVVVSSSGDRTCRILLNDPDELGVLSERPAIELSFVPAAVIAGDLDGDGHVDLAFTGLEDEVAEGALSPVLGILGGDGIGNFVVETVLPVDALGASLECGDLNGDGMCDLVAGQPSLFNEDVWCYMSMGGFEFEGYPMPIGGSPGAVNLFDVNRDGDLDLLVPTGEGKLKLALGDGNGTFPVIEPPAAGGWPVPVGAVFSALADLDGDGLPDLVMVSPKTPNVWVGKNVSVEIPAM
jgi:hypothetical protein